MHESRHTSFYAKSSLVFPRHPRVAQTLFNYEDILAQWAAGHPHANATSYQCAPEAPMFGEHVAASGHHSCCSFSTLDKEVVSGSTGNTYFPSQRQPRTQVRAAWTDWCRANHPKAYLKSSASAGQGTNSRSTADITAMWLTASGAKHRVPYGTGKTTNHAPQSVTVLCCTTSCCPARLAIAMCLKRSQKILTVRFRTFQRQQSALQRRYSWAFRRTPTVPAAYALPKGLPSRKTNSVLCRCCHATVG